MKIEKHEQNSQDLFWGKYTKIHEFLDHYFPMFGPLHRIVLHHQRGIDLLKKEFPQENPVIIGKVAEQHIIDDLGKVPEDWREGVCFDLEYADTWLGRKTALEKGDLKAMLKNLYGGLI